MRREPFLSRKEWWWFAAGKELSCCFSHSCKPTVARTTHGEAGEKLGDLGEHPTLSYAMAN